MPKCSKSGKITHTQRGENRGKWNFYAITYTRGEFGVCKSRQKLQNGVFQNKVLQSLGPGIEN